MVVDLLCYGGGRYALPQLFDWKIDLGSGEPCDSGEFSCAYTPEMAEILKKCWRITASWKGKIVFTGVLDEWEADIGEKGAILRLSGRGMAALLLDNEVEAAEFDLARLEEILRLYVRPFGITEIESAELPGVEGFRVESGSSAWDALCSFTQAAGNVTPRFSPEGKLLIGKEENSTRKVGKETALYRLRRRERRYGVISEVLVKNKVLGTQESVKNEAFLARGGACRRVMTVPRYTGYEKMRWTGAYQIRASQRGKDSLELFLPELFAAGPGEKILLDREETGFSGTYIVRESLCFGGETGAGTILSLEGV